MPESSLSGTNTLAHAEITFLVDRGVGKIRVNLFKDGKIRGFLKPIVFFLKDGRVRAVSREASNYH